MREYRLKISSYSFCAKIVQFTFLMLSDFCSTLRKGFKNLDRHFVTSKIKQLHLVIIEILKSMLKGQKFSLTSDHWTSAAGTTYLAVTIHYINKDWKLVNFTLSCTEHSGRTTAAACKKEIMAALELYDLRISDAVALVTDTENTMTLLGKIIDGDHHYCLAHVLELTTVCICSLHHIIPLFIIHILFLKCYFLLFIDHNQKQSFDGYSSACKRNISWAPSPTPINFLST